MTSRIALNRWLWIGLIYLAVLSIYAVILNNKYIDVDEGVVSIVYYIPLMWTDIALFVLTAAIGLCASLYFYKLKNKKIIIALAFVYTVTASIISIYGNDILGSREEYWPHTYKAQPLESIR